MKKISLAIALLSFVFLSCEKVTGDGPVVTETRNISGFSGIDLRVAGDVYFTQDPNFKVEVRAQQNILEVTETYVSDNRLVIRFKNNVRVRSHEPLAIFVSAPTANHFRISGSGKIVSTGALNPSNMELDISGSGNIEISELQTGVIDATISGSGDIKINSGSATEEKLRISGSGDIDLANVLAGSANTTTSGSGDIRLHAANQLTVKISGSGSVYYKGTPVINTNISGSGKLVHF